MSELAPPRKKANPPPWIELYKLYSVKNLENPGPAAGVAEYAAAENMAAQNVKEPVQHLSKSGDVGKQFAIVTR
ncbi:hypothetical protein [Sphingopyxis sp. BSNA05]|uniref:hypothetical protein n=1 Tax=Sphingopyxis sp. BSNA05 TaxID=1236614 RepID=UPI001563F6D9|nr:hypothetical protein [Sphingopyxis sp. BSNA05]